MATIDRSLRKHRNGNTEMANETDDVKAVEQLGIARDGVVKELRKVIVGMEDVWKLTFTP